MDIIDKSNFRKKKSIKWTKKPRDKSFKNKFEVQRWREHLDMRDSDRGEKWIDTNYFSSKAFFFSGKFFYWFGNDTITIFIKIRSKLERGFCTKETCQPKYLSET